MSGLDERAQLVERRDEGSRILGVARSSAAATLGGSLEKVARLLTLPRLCLIGAASLLLAAGGSTSPSQAGEAVAVTIKRSSVVANSGQEVLVRLAVTCEPTELQVLEALVQVHQDSVFGEGFFQPICDGVKRFYNVRVPTFDGTFTTGPAHASAFILLCNDEGSLCEQGQDSGTIRIRRGRR